jgi:ADP-dependent NAD(P)H-hydrate dehydratase / NAD(P)H-hydrate epimerase
MRINNRCLSKHSDRPIITTKQMRAIESLMFEAGMPVAALMEKVAGLITTRIETLYPLAKFPKVGLLIGCGHNGGDALVVARELWHRGWDVKIWMPIPKLKPLPAEHWRYLESLGLNLTEFAELKTCDFLIDGLFGFGLERAIAGELADRITEINTFELPILSIDLPSGIHTDTGAVMGTAIKATHTICLGLWKRGLFMEVALAYIGDLERIDFDIPVQFIQQVLNQNDESREILYRIAPKEAIAKLPSQRPIATHKYQMGHLLLIGGSQRYGGAVILAALGARASGVGMLSIAVPESLRDLVLAKVPEALIISCPETSTGAIAYLDSSLDFSKYTAIACGVGISLDAMKLVEQVLSINSNLILDADALSLLAQIGIDKLQERSPLSTILTPHWGEFCRLFPPSKTEDVEMDRLIVLQNAAIQTGGVILLKGARTAISFITNSETKSEVQTWINPESTPALARGGSGDVLTGIMGGLLAQKLSTGDSAIAATVWHAQTGIWLAKKYSQMAVNPLALAENLCNLKSLNTSY